MSDNNGQDSRELRMSVPLRDYLESLVTAQGEMYKHLLEERELRYEQRFKAQQDAVSAAMAAADKAINKTEIDTDRHFANTNEWRDSLNDFVQSLLTKSEYEGKHEALMVALSAANKQSTDANDALRRDVIKDIAAITDRVNGFNRWLVGALGGVVVALILTIVDILVRQFS